MVERKSTLSGCVLDWVETMCVWFCVCACMQVCMSVCDLTEMWWEPVGNTLRLPDEKWPKFDSRDPSKPQLSVGPKLYLCDKNMQIKCIIFTLNVY